MATSNGNGDGKLGESSNQSKTLQDGDRILAPTRRPDGTLRKPIRIRAGYVPQDEVAIYQSKGALLKKGNTSSMFPPGYDPPVSVKPKSKSVRRNERKKEKKMQSNLEKDKTLLLVEADKTNMEDQAVVEHVNHGLEILESVESKFIGLSVSTNLTEMMIPSNLEENSNHGDDIPHMDKKIRAIRKKIRLLEARQHKTKSQDSKHEQSEKATKLEEWRRQLKLLEASLCSKGGEKQ